MKNNGRFAIFVILALIALFASERRHTVSAQGCPPSIYTAEVFPWGPGSTVSFTFDPAGAAVGAPYNPVPNFVLNDTMMANISTGVQAWNSHMQTDGTDVEFLPNSTLSLPWIISTAWPKATVTYTDSQGHSHNWPVDATPPPGKYPAATTFYLPDYNYTGGYSGFAAAAVTLINTNGTYPVNGTNYPIWNPNAAGFNAALQNIGTHEAGHGFSLGDQSGCGDIMSPWGPASPSNPTGGTNNQGGCQSGVITGCDDGEVEGSPYAPYDPSSCPPQNCGDGYGWDQSTCSCVPIQPCDCNACGCSPILIDVGGSGYQLTNYAHGVVFDMQGTGHPFQMAWTAPGADNAFLALPGPDGLIHNGKQLFGTFTPQPPSTNPNGFAALAMYDKSANGGNGDGVIDSKDAIFSSLRLWIDANHDGISQPEELHTLPSLGVYSISLTYKFAGRRDQYGNFFRYRAQVNPGTVTTVGRMAYDVFFVATANTAGKIPKIPNKCSVPSHGMVPQKAAGLPSR